MNFAISAYVFPLPDFGTQRSGGELPNQPLYFPSGTSYTACQYACQDNPSCQSYDYDVNGWY
jgi:hypothetical protein